MSVLDDPDAISRADPSDFLGVVESFSQQLVEARRRALETKVLPPADGVTSIAVLGMGGSGLSGDVLRVVLGPDYPLPIVSVKGYELPGWVGPDTLVFAVSYSGNTEEILEAFEKALERKARVLAVASGGKLLDRAAEEFLGFIQVPGGLQPRAALGYLATPVLVACERLGVASSVLPQVEEAIEVLQRRSQEWGREVPADQNVTKQTAELLAGKVPVVYGSEGLGEVAAYRWKCHLNECSKAPAFSAAFPELNHNEIVGWGGSQGVGPFAFVFLRHRGEHPRTEGHVGFTERQVPGPSAVVTSEASSPLARLLELIYHGDFAATYLAILRGVDPAPVEVIEALKRELSGEES